MFISYVIKINGSVYKTTKTPLIDLLEIKCIQRKGRMINGACGPVSINHCSAWAICEDRNGVLSEREIA